MDFNSIDEILSHFDLNAQDADEAKKELKNLIKKVHPDKHNGNFKNDKDKDLYHEIQSALLCLDGASNTALSTKNEITALTKVIKDLAVARKEEVSAGVIERKGSSLTNKLQESIESFHKRHSTPKITGVVLTAIITALWAFPSVVKDHPLLSFLYRFNREFTIIWILCLIFTGYFWMRIKISEKRDEEIKRSYKLESTQNYIFNLFMNWMKSSYRHYEIIGDKRFVKFCKDDLINFLITRYEFLQHNLRGAANLSDFEIEDRIRQFENSNSFRERKQTINSIPFLRNYLPIPGEIDLEIAQLISDLIIERLNAKGAITKCDSKKLSDFYEYEDTN